MLLDHPYYQVAKQIRADHRKTLLGSEVRFLPTASQGIRSGVDCILNDGTELLTDEAPRVP